MTALLLEISIFSLKAVIEIPSDRYGPKHASQLLTYTTLCAYLDSYVENYKSYGDIVHTER